MLVISTWNGGCYPTNYITATAVSDAPGDLDPVSTFPSEWYPTGARKRGEARIPSRNLTSHKTLSGSTTWRNIAAPTLAQYHNDSLVPTLWACIRAQRTSD